ncbi:MAG: hypothetical protein C4589_11210 [Peptococcaceae bacterium]|nr:MAG: hypothetical protein C4589_11210 [Peptococcaceae bacterium]
MPPKPEIKKYPIKVRAPEFIRTYEYTRETGLREINKAQSRSIAFRQRFQKMYNELILVLKKQKG